MNASYRPRLHTTAPSWLAYGGVRPLSVGALRSALADTTIHAFTGSLESGYDIELGRDRVDHHVALDEIALALGYFGFSFAEAYISESVRLTTQGAVAGLIAGGGAAARTRDPLAMTAGATAGAIVGGIAAAFVRRELARCVARRDPWAGLSQVL